MEFKDLSIGAKFILIYKHETIQNIVGEKEIFIKTGEVNEKEKGPGKAINLSNGELTTISYHTPAIQIKI